MARPGVTYLEVSNAAQKLIAAGKSPTIESVRHILGTGSNSTLGAHLRNWKLNQDQTQQIANAEHIPTELISSLQGLWGRVMDQAEEKIQAAQDTAKLQSDTLKHEIIGLKHEMLALQASNQDLKHERDWFKNEHAALEQIVNNAKVEIAVMSEKAASSEQQQQEKLARINELHKQNQQIQTNLEHYRTASNEQRMADQLRHDQQIRQTEMIISQLKTELSQTQRENVALQQNEQQLNFENANIKGRYETLNVEHEAMMGKLNAQQIELAKTLQLQQDLQTQNNSLQAKFEAQNKLMLEAQTQNAVFMQQVAQKDAEIKEIHEQNKVLSHEKWVLGQEKAHLYGQFKQLEAAL